MEITEIPFNKFLGIKRVEHSERGILQLDDASHYTNHLGTVHASAQFALAEACSGEYLLSHFGELALRYVPVVRTAEVKFKRPASGELYGKPQALDAQMEEFKAALATRGRAIIGVKVDIEDSRGTVTMTAVFEWLIQKQSP